MRQTAIFLEYGVFADTSVQYGLGGLIVGVNLYYVVVWVGGREGVQGLKAVYVECAHEVAL